jgi:hypothetical protein
MTQIIIQGPAYGSTQPVRLTVNGRETSFPATAGRPSTTSSSTRSATPTTIRPSRRTAADEAEQAPAPAGSGDGGDAGGGGPSGDAPAADTTEAPDEEAELPLNFLDRSVTAIIADLPTLNAAQLAKAKADEDAGKTRKSLLAAIDEALAAPAACHPPHERHDA